MYRGSSIELNAFGESWRCRKCQKHTTACLGHDRGFLVATECRKCQEQATASFGSQQRIPGRDRVLFFRFRSRQGFSLSR